MKHVVLEKLTADELTQLLDKGNEIVLNPKGKSMLPFIRQGRDKVKLGRPMKIKQGDIVLACINGRYLLHRVYVLDGENVTLMGDGNLCGTESGTLADVIGVVTEIISKKGHRHKPGKAWLWRHTRRLRRYQLKAYRKWNRIFNI